ncbi:GlxA family transcriptional regulator [Ramlibacter albus]|uniref:GlxA family transcriptional regulator n=1 Tax=Ramlibacter albus TaxID=2079448 RepID=A0A923M8U8_9BURK|nr:GlxA family transcriptional regulator [Ramlibacter albus]MBC5765948.1 GlxA family transcriptional regulator [Ramlibacter albus]
MRRRISILVFPRFQLLDAAGPIAAFEAARGHYELRVVAAAAGEVRSSSRVAMVADALPRTPSGDTLLVSGGFGVDEAAKDDKLLAYLRRAERAGLRVASVCSGSILLAAAGLLDGRTATTHWSRTSQFREMFPKVNLDADRIFVQEGRIWTSAGITAGIDLALAMISHDVGPEIARRVAQELVVYYRRPGGQSQFSALLSMQGGRSRFDAVLDHVRQNLKERHSVEELAERAFMSPRHFARAFHEETGVTPAKAVERIRVEAARTALDAGAASVQKVADQCGFGDPERMRRSFARLLGITPSSLRRTASA